MIADRAWIAAHIPHRGAMCLLDSIEHADATSIVCRTATHRDLGHPLLHAGRLGAASGIEYAAQAMAVHAAWLAAVETEPRSAGDADTRPGVGYLVRLREVVFHVARLDDVEDELVVACHRDAATGPLLQCRFELRAGSRTLLDGTASVLLEAPR